MNWIFGEKQLIKMSGFLIRMRENYSFLLKKRENQNDELWFGILVGWECSINRQIIIGESGVGL